MPRLLKQCCAPRPYNSNILCRQEFLADVPHALYCSPTCANRARRRNRLLNHDKALLGLRTPGSGAGFSPIHAAAYPRTGDQPQPQPQLPPQIQQLNPTIVAEVRKLAESDKDFNQASSADVLAKLGFLRKSAPAPAEPSTNKLPQSTDDSPPDFRHTNRLDEPIDPEDL